VQPGRLFGLIRKLFISIRKIEQLELERIKVYIGGFSVVKFKDKESEFDTHSDHISDSWYENVEEVARNSYANINAILNCGPQAILLVGKDYNLQAINNNIEKFAGLLFSKVIKVGQPIQDCIIKDYRREFFRNLMKAFEGDSVHYGLQVKNHEDYQYRFDVYYKPIIVGQDEVLGVYVTFLPVNIHNEGKHVISLKRELEKILTHVYYKLSDSSDFDEAIHNSLADICQLIGVSSGCIILFNENRDYIDREYRWSARSANYENQKFTFMPCSMFSWLMDKLQNTQYICVNHISELPPEAINEKRFLNKRNIISFATFPLIISERLAGFINLDTTERGEKWSDENILFSRMAAKIFSNALEHRRTKSALESSYYDLAETLFRTLESKDPYTAGHQKRVAELAKCIGQQMELGKSRITELYIGSLLHDIGKLKIPTAILTKPTNLTVIEFALIKEHPTTGYEIIKDTKLPTTIREIVRCHHEKLDGSGYPDGIKGDKINQEVRIVTVCDVVEAMSTFRPYRPARTKKEVFEELKNGRGIKYDAQVVDVMLELITKDLVNPWENKKSSV
jgi:HD-GYP domain-containing protein (c-di-GMP phosphodiesterase class II)/PAS domain-containing protein